MSRIAVVIPVAQETNLITNPSIETATTGYTAVGATLTRVATQQKRGVYSLSIAPTAGTTDGAYYEVSLTSGTTYTFSIDVLGVVSIPYLIRFATTGGTTKASTTFTGTGGWQRLSVTWTADATATFRLYVTKNSHASTGTFYADGALCSAVSAETTYFDGDTKGFYSGDYYWTGTPNASTSVRKAYIRHGGRIANIETEFSFVEEDVMGMGMGRIANVLLPLALLGGSVFQRQVAQNRLMTIAGTVTGTTYQDLQQQRREMVSALGPNPYGRDEPVMLLWRTLDGASGAPYMELPALYAGGLEGNKLSGTSEFVTLQFEMYLPYVSAQGNDAAVLDWQDTHTSAYISQRSAAGLWSAMGSGANAQVLCLVVGPDGALYAGGEFTSMGGVANTAYIAKWNGSAWSALGTGANGFVNSLAFGPDGVLYAGGSFTSMGGVANTSRIAKWNGSAWSALATGMNGAVESLAMGVDGSLYAGGTFTLADGVANTVRIAKWNGSAWSALSTGISSGAVKALETGPDGVLYVGGTFTSAGGVSGTAYIAKWNGSAWSALSTGMNLYVRALIMGPDGALYAAGDFTSAGGVSTNYIAKWNGSAWSALSTGMNLDVYALAFGLDGALYAGGAFTLAGGVSTNYIAKWNGSAWSRGIDFTGSGTAIIKALAEFYDMRNVGLSTTGTATTNGTTSVTNSGTLPAHPIVKFTGPGTIYSIRNLTTGADIDFNLTLVAGETATLDLTPGAVSFVSSMRGNILGTIIPGSDVTSFMLAVGANNITAFIAGTTDGNTAAVMTWAENYAGIDGGSQ